MADSNVLMPRDYLQRLLARLAPDTGLLCAPPIGCLPHGFWAEVECAFLNTYQARWQYAADTVGLGFAQGKTMLWRRADLEQAGGIRALGAEIAEDAAATKVVRRAGRRVRLVDRRLRPAAGAALGRAGVVAPGALGQAEARDVPRLLPARDRLGQPHAAARRRLRGAVARPVGRGRRSRRSPPSGTRARRCLRARRAGTSGAGRRSPGSCAI